MDSRPSGRLREFAEAISSAKDPGLAEWQELGLQNPKSLPGIIAWSIAAASVTAALVVLVLGFEHIVWPSIRLLFEPHPLTPRGGILTLSFALAVLTASGTIAFAAFQGGTRLRSFWLGASIEKNTRDRGCRAVRVPHDLPLAPTALGAGRAFVAHCG